MMFKLKRGFYLGLGILTQLFVCYIFKLILFSLLNNMNKDTSQLAGIIMGSLIGILCVVVIQLILLAGWPKKDANLIFNQKVNKIMDWDGHLDKVTRRDDKLDKLGIK